ncbi:hypothetical protein WR25_21455 [Diploscapter pachys]|uniref:VWFA domain-containing protein n=1 Tax=Diploscapter pachys TaxID=2018661 RepID=A0A2A2JER3_9BILA|nr:hypothetical protein WR25_21455 [Diploscapter pachys]
MTDGIPNCCEEEIGDIVNEFNKKNGRTFGIGIGNGIDENTLKVMLGGKHDMDRANRHYRKADSFRELNNAMIEDIMEVVCDSQKE